MKIQRKFQKGIMLIEVIAVLGLIAAITPMLFQQISRRNDDILNIQIATEMRSAKEALAAFIKANEHTIATSYCQDLVYTADDGAGHKVGDYKPTDKSDGGEVCSSGSALRNAVAEYYAGDPSVLAEYEFIINAYTVPSHTDDGVQYYRPIIYGTVHQRPISGAAPQKLKDASKIASLIGLDGGVVVDGTITGMQGSWTLDSDIEGVDTVPDNTVVATTLFDEQTNSAILKDVKIENFKGKTVTTDQAMADRMAVKEALLVGDVNCVEALGEPTMNIQTASEALDAYLHGHDRNCLPFFEVSDDGVSIRDGRIGTNLYYQAYIPNPDGGEPIVKKESAASGIFQLDLSGTSMMDDIRLASLGNASLSEAMPKWSLMAVMPAICRAHGEVTTECISKDPQNYGNPCTEASETCICSQSTTKCLATDTQVNNFLLGFCNDSSGDLKGLSCSTDTDCCKETETSVQCAKRCVKQNYCINFGDWQCPHNYRHAFVAIPAGNIDPASPYLPVAQRDTVVAGTSGVDGKYYNTSYGSNVSTSNPFGEAVAAHAHSIQVHTHRVYVPVARSSIEGRVTLENLGTEVNYDMKHEKNATYDNAIDRKYAMSCYNHGEYYLIHAYCVNPIALIPNGGVRWEKTSCANGQYFDPVTASCKCCDGEPNAAGNCVGRIAPLGANSATYCMAKCPLNYYPDINTRTCMSCPDGSTTPEDENDANKAKAYSIKDCKCPNNKTMYKGRCL